MPWLLFFDLITLTLCTLFLLICLLYFPSKFYISVHCSTCARKYLCCYFIMSILRNSEIRAYHFWEKYIHCQITEINEGEITNPSIGALNQSNAVSCHFGFPFPGQVNFRLRAIFLILDYRRRGYRSRHLRIKWKGRLAMGFDRWNEFSMEVEIEDLERRSKRSCEKKRNREREGGGGKREGERERELAPVLHGASSLDSLLFLLAVSFDFLSRVSSCYCSFKFQQLLVFSAKVGMSERQDRYE